MTSTTVLMDDAATVVADESSRFSWGITIAGAVVATATSFFLITLGAGVGLALTTAPATPGGATSFLTLGAIWFFASQAFGFAVGGYLVGRLIGPEAENAKEEEFRAAAHGFAMWAIAVVAGLLLVAASSTLAASAVAGGNASRGDTAATQSYWVDDMFRPAPYSAQVAADKAEAARILAMTGMAPLRDSDTARIGHLVAQDAGISMQAGVNRVLASESDMRAAAEKTRKAASMLSLWTAFALLFGAVVSVAAAISARWMDDKITFSLAPRRQIAR
jgi:hypothetical protein